MSNRRVDSFKDLKTGKADWKVPATVMNLWRGFSKSGEAFKGFNTLLLDHKRARIHAFVPGNIAEGVENLIEVGKIFMFKNFNVKEYKNEDKFRPIMKKIQIQLTNDSLIKEMEETEYSIEKFWFDFYELGDLKTLAKQMTYLTDVIGVIEEHQPIGKIKNKNGIIQSQLKFNITDGSSSLKVTFWDDFAEIFDGLMKGEEKYPLILIIAGARIQLWGEEVVISNVVATNTYINVNHYSVTEMRKRLAQNKFPLSKLSTQANRCTLFYKLKDMQNLGTEHIETQVLAQVQLTNCKDVQKWCHAICTSCYQKISIINNEETCTYCQRVVPYADKKFECYMEAKDDTGSIIIMLEDREMRTMLGKSVFQLIEEGNHEDKLPTIFKTLENKEYTVKINITEKNVKDKENLYMATDIMQGSYLEKKDTQQNSYPHPIENMEAQPSGSSYQMGSMTS